ncbi:MAG: VOC family protein [Burkholderiales bacterium]|nr:VOC family protein [Burkholderiales bacterium]
MKMLLNLLSRDPAAQMAFYAALFGFEEITASRSPIYRVLDTGDSELGFNAPEARALLALPDAPPPMAEGLLPTTAFGTFMLDTHAEVDALAARAQALGGRVLKAPFVTYYRQWQAVLADPEGHVFRIASLQLPAGV